MLPSSSCYLNALIESGFRGRRSLMTGNEKDIKSKQKVTFIAKFNKSRLNYVFRRQLKWNLPALNAKGLNGLTDAPTSVYSLIRNLPIDCSIRVYLPRTVFTLRQFAYWIRYADWLTKSWLISIWVSARSIAHSPEQIQRAPFQVAEILSAVSPPPPGHQLPCRRIMIF